MKKIDYKSIVLHIARTLGLLVGIVIAITLLGGIYIVGYYHGALTNQAGIIASYNDYNLTDFANKLVSVANIVAPQPTLVPQKVVVQEQQSSNDGIWGGPDLWKSVNARRSELGVSQLKLDDELCTLASIRLNDQLAINKLDGHEGFNNMTTIRPDLIPIFNKYGHTAEFLARGGESPGRTVAMWENSLGHQKLLNSPDYIWGCIYAQNTFAVAITAF